MTTRDDSEQQTRPTSMPDAPIGSETQPVVCPFCGSRDTELLSPFASQLSTSQYVCRACRSPFEYFKHEAARDT